MNGTQGALGLLQASGHWEGRSHCGLGWLGLDGLDGRGRWSGQRGDLVVELLDLIGHRLHLGDHGVFHVHVTLHAILHGVHVSLHGGIGGVHLGHVVRHDGVHFGRV